LKAIGNVKIYPKMNLLKTVFLWTFFVPIKHMVWFLPYSLIYRLSFIIAGSRLWLKTKKAKAYSDELSHIRLVSAMDEKNSILQRTFWGLLCCEFEMLLFPRMNSANINDFVNYNGLEHLDAALDKGKGVMLLFGHFGANQMVMPAMGYCGYSMSQLSAPATVWEKKIPGRTFLAIEKYAMRKRWQHEKSLPVVHVNIFSSLKGAFRCLKRNEILGAAIDGGGGAERVAVNFLDGQANFSTGAYEIARRTGCAVLPTFMERDLFTGKNELYIENALYIKKENNSLEDKKQFIQFFAYKLDFYIRRSPWLYINFLALRRMMSAHDEIPFMIKK